MFTIPGSYLHCHIPQYYYPSQYILLKRLTDHIDINYVVPTEMVKSKKGEKETKQHTEELIDTELQILDLMLLKFLSNALQLNL